LLQHRHAIHGSAAMAHPWAAEACAVTRRQILQRKNGLAVLFKKTIFQQAPCVNKNPQQLGTTALEYLSARSFFIPRIACIVAAQASAAHGWAISGRAMEGVPALSQDDKFGSELKFQNRISAREQPIQVPGKPSANE